MPATAIGALIDLETALPMLGAKCGGCFGFSAGIVALLREASLVVPGLFLLFLLLALAFVLFCEHVIHATQAFEECCALLGAC